MGNKPPTQVTIGPELVAFLWATKERLGWGDTGIRLNTWKGWRKRVSRDGCATASLALVAEICYALNCRELPVSEETQTALRQFLENKRRQRASPDESTAHWTRDPDWQAAYRDELRRIREGDAESGSGVSDQSPASCPRSAEVGRQRAADVSLWRLPATGSVFVGRQDELRALDDAWASPSIHAVVLLGVGGSGKTALVNEWLSRLSPHFHGAAKVFGWTFSEAAFAPALFVEHAMAFFGAPAECGSTVLAERLVKGIREQRTLLVLDAIENVLDVQSGDIAVESIKIVVKELAFSNHGLLILTSRICPTDVAHLTNRTRVIQLPPLTRSDCLGMLERLGIPPNDSATVEALHERCRGNSLSMRVVAGFVGRCLGGDWSRLPTVRLADADRHQKGALSSVARTYDGYLSSVDRAVLNLASTFSDGRLPRQALRVLMQSPSIAELQAAIPDEIDEIEATKSLAALEELGLVNRPRPDAIDVHPIVQEYYSLQLGESSRQECYRRLRDFYRQQANKDDELDCAYTAVSCGQKAGLLEDAVDDFRTLVNRDTGRSWDLHGKFAANLELLRPFFLEPWNKPHPNLSPRSCAYLLFECAWYMRAEGHLLQAIPTLVAALEKNEEVGEYRQAMLAAIHLAFVGCEIGDFSMAERHVARGHLLANRMQSVFWREAVSLIEGYVWHQQGLPAAGKRFRRANEVGLALEEDDFDVAIGAHLIIEYHLSMIGNPGLFPCPLKKRPPARAWEAIAAWLGRLNQVVEAGESRLAAGLHRLAVAHVQAICLCGARPKVAIGLQNPTVSQLLDGLDAALRALRAASLQHFTLPGMVLSASIMRALATTLDARDLPRPSGEMLSDALNIATQALKQAESQGSRLFQLEAELEVARIMAVFDRRSELTQHVRTARHLIEEHGFERRRGELEAIEDVVGRQ